MGIACSLLGPGAAGPAVAAGPPTEVPPLKVERDPKAVTAPSTKLGSWAAKIVEPTAARDAPGGTPVSWVEVATSFNRQAQYLLVLGTRRTADGREWLRVRLPVRPNTAAGWIPRERALLERRRDSININLSRREVVVKRARGEERKPAVVGRSRAVVGAAATPTPTGLFAIYETIRQPDPNAFLGNWALHLTAHSDVLFNFGGGDGRVAIHGRGGESLATPLGKAASNGCVRMPNKFMSWLRKAVRPGTPVRIAGR